MTKSLCACAALCFATACGSSDDGAPAVADSATTTDSAPADAPPADTTATTDTATTDTPSSDAGACSPTGGLPAPAAGKAVVQATFSEADGTYNGMMDAFSGAELYGSTDPDGARFVSYNKAPSPSDATARQMIIAVGPMAKACQVFTTPKMASASYPYFEYYEGAMLRKQFVCGGTVVVDTVSGKEYTFHFDVTCTAKPVLDGKGSVRVIGKGAGTRA